MKKLYTLLLLAVSTQVVAEVATFSTENQLLTIPTLVINGSGYYQDVELYLDVSTGEYTIMSAKKISGEEVGKQNVLVSFGSPGTLFTNDTLTVLDIQDSRCPTGAECIVAGEVTVSLQLSDHVTSSITLMSLTLEGNGSIAGEEVRTEQYTFRLLEATPYPSVSETIADGDYQFKVEYSLTPF